MQLIIVESPTKARTLSRFLGKDYTIEATMGHVKDLPKSQLGIDVKKNFKPEYAFIEKRKDAVEKIKKAAKKASKIYLATDPDREGEAIAHHVREILSDSILSKNRRKPVSQYPSILVSRIVFHEITKEAVEEAIKKPRDIDKNLVDAQVGRRVLDRLVGYKLSPLLWKKVRRGLSAGRVQTVAVRLIVEREREIEAFKPDEYWEISCEVKPKSKESFWVKFIGNVKNKSEAGKILTSLKKAKYSVSDVRKREVRKNPYPPFTTSTMAQAGARIFGWSAKRTMSIAQRLYEKGFITYHRTDSAYVSDSALKKVRELIGTDFGKEYLPPSPRFYKVTSKVAQEAHEAIRPTDVGQITNAKLQMPNDEKKLYELIWKRFVASQMTASVYDETAIDVHAKNSETYLLRASGQMIKFDGWTRLRQGYAGQGKSTDQEARLPEVRKGEALQLIKVDSTQKFTEPPARYNEASLIKTLEQLGIGRPSTYAPIISTIQIRNYVEKDEGKFIPTPVGVGVNDFLIEHFPEVFDYQFTAEMEGDLDKVADGKNKWEEIIKKFWNPFEKKLSSTEDHSKRVKIETEKLGLACPKCKKARLAGDKSRQGELVVRIGRFGKFISCSRFPDCDFTEKYIEKIGMKCPKCKKGDVIVKKTGKGKKFYGCSLYPKCDFASWRNPKPEPKTQNVEQAVK